MDPIRVSDDPASRAGTKVIWVVVIAITGLIRSIVYLTGGVGRAGGG